MDWLNYHHLLYFWTVAREGGLSPAARKLRVTHSTVGAQVHALEESLGEKLLVRSGRRLVPTPMGLVVLRYADEIFGLGRELVDTVQGRPTGQPIRVSVGVVQALPKLVARRLLQPAHQLSVPVRMVCREDHLDRLLADLAVHTLDVVLSDSPPTTTGPVRVFGHALGDSEVSFFAAPKLARQLAPGFPRSLDGAPIILPAESSALRRTIDAWLVRLRVRPNVIAEIEDSALLKSFGQDGLGAFPAPSIVREQVVRQYGVRELGVARGVIERFFAITAERRFDHPAIAAITEHARDVFSAKKKKPARREPPIMR